MSAAMSRGPEPERSRPDNNPPQLARAQRAQPAEGLGQHFFSLAERKPDLESPSVRMVVEDLHRDRHDTGSSWQSPAELQPAASAEGLDIGRDEVGPVRP